jgi:hypothetical protein
MKTFFKKDATQKATTPKQTTNEIVLEIHDTFNTEVERLMLEARQSIEADVNHTLINDANKLKSLGFFNAKETKIGEVEADALSKIEKENTKKAETIKAINYFSQKYPLYKFITEESILKICTKYGLIYGEVSKYIGNVPKNKVESMLKFKLNENDYSYTIQRNRSYSRSSEWITVNFKEGTSLYHSESDTKYYWFKKKNFIIAAPLKDFDTNGMEVEKFKLIEKKVIPVPDPVVMQPVLYNNIEYYLIVTAWGEEASDVDVVNQIMN